MNTPTPTETKHTPGPWDYGWGAGISGPTCPSISGPFVAAKWPYTVVIRGGECIAIVPAQEGSPHQVVPYSAEANARLIAAAPWLALLAEAFAMGWTLTRASLYDEEAVDGWRLTSTGGEDFEWVGEITEVDARMFEAARAAIAKARQP